MTNNYLKLSHKFHEGGDLFFWFDGRNQESVATALSAAHDAGGTSKTISAWKKKTEKGYAITGLVAYREVGESKVEDDDAEHPDALVS